MKAVSLGEHLAESRRDPEYIKRCAEIEEEQTFGRLLRSAREALGLTQTQVAEIVGVQQPYIAKVEAGWKVPSLPNMRKLAQAVGKNLKISYSLV